MEYNKLLLPFEKYHLPQKRVDGDLPLIVQEFNNQVAAGVYRLYWDRCLCGNKEFELIASVDRFGFIAPLAVCNHCGMIHSNPHFSELYYDDLKKHKGYYETFLGYDDVKEYTMSKYNTLEGSDIFNMVKRVVNMTNDTSVLEIEAGAGWNLLPFINAGVKVKGYESDRAFVDIAREFGMNIEQKTIENLPENADFDVLILSGVVNRLFTPLETLKAMLNLVRDQGIIYIDVPLLNFKTLDYRVDWLYYFTEDSLRYFMTSIGLKPLEIKKSQGVLSGVFRKESFPNSKYLLTRNKSHTLKKIKKLRRAEHLRLSKKIKNKDNVLIFRLLEEVD